MRSPSHRTIKVLTVPPGSSSRRKQVARRVEPTGAKWNSAATSSPPRMLRPRRLDPRGLAQGHWGIENRLDWGQDLTFDDDRSQAHTVAATTGSWRSGAMSLSARRILLAGPSSPRATTSCPDQPRRLPSSRSSARLIGDPLVGQLPQGPPCGERHTSLIRDSDIPWCRRTGVSDRMEDVCRRRNSVITLVSRASRAIGW